MLIESEGVDHLEDLLLLASFDLEERWHIVIHINIEGMLTYDVAESTFGFGSHWFESSLLKEEEGIFRFVVRSKFIFLSDFEGFMLLLDLKCDMRVGPVKGSNPKRISLLVQKPTRNIVVIIVNYSFKGFESSELFEFGGELTHINIENFDFFF